MMKRLSEIARVISGIVFIFSGLSKGVDPLGSMYKFIDYFTAFNLDSLNNLALVLGIILCTAEFVIGFAVLTGIRIKEAAWGLLLFMAAFTPLTLVLAISNPVSDCGCFGDAVHLSNWQTFFKNIIILGFVLIVFIRRKKYDTLNSPRSEWITTVIAAGIFVLFIIINYYYLPIIDYRPYSTGTDINEAMLIPEDAPVDQYDVSLIYEKDGVSREFTLENYPSDSSWTFVDQKSVLIKKGYTPPIHDFSLTNIYGEDLTDIILSKPGFTLLMVSTKMTDADPLLIDGLMEEGNEAFNSGYSFYIVTASSADDIFAYNSDHLFLRCDETTVKTIVRSNPGFVLLADGAILNKWSQKSFPGITEVLSDPDNYIKNSGLNRYVETILYIFIVLIISQAVRIILETDKKRRL